MADFLSNGIRISYSVEGEGEPILLIHGFASNRNVNWAYTGWVKTLADDGRMVISIDNRGHGESEKLYDSALYSSPIMAEDASNLLDHLGIPQADVMGYSMGARISAFLSLAHPQKVRSAIFGGLGIGMVKGVGLPQPIVDALLADSDAEVTDPTGRAFRTFALQTKSDLKALAACMSSSRQTLTPEELSGITVPVLVAVGTKDTIGGSPQDLADIIPGARAVDIPNRDHMVAVGDKVYKAAALDFLKSRA